MLQSGWSAPQRQQGQNLLAVLSLLLLLCLLLVLLVLMLLPRLLPPLVVLHQPLWVVAMAGWPRQRQSQPLTGWGCSPWEASTGPVQARTAE